MADKAVTRGHDTEDLDAARDPRRLTTAIGAIYESLQRYFGEYPEWRERLRTHRAERIAMQQNLQAIQSIAARMRLVLAVLPPFDTEADWSGVEAAARKLDERRGGVDL